MNDRRAKNNILGSSLSARGSSVFKKLWATMPEMLNTECFILRRLYDVMFGR